jgi:hypothetical protein
MRRTTLDKYLKRWGFTPQRPVIYNRQQNEAEVEKWLNETFPLIKQRAKAEGGEIFWVCPSSYTSETKRCSC